MYVKRNIESHLRNHCCRGKGVGVTYSECVFVAVVTQHAKFMRHVVVCALFSFTIFFHIISRFSEKGY
jgi:hypothetical protein